MRVRFVEAAEAELDEASSFYEQSEAGLRERFLAEAEQAVRSLAADPLRSPKLGRRHRRRLLEDFPYGIIYRVGLDEVVVVAVIHLSRKPGYWRRRDV
jgi:toxin ParE2